MADYNLNYTDSISLLAAYEENKAPNTFLQSRYFPDGTTFSTDEVIIEYKEGSQKLAPFVSPEIGGVAMRRNGYSVKTFKPGNIAPKRTLTLDTLKKKGFGEAYYHQLSPDERALLITAQDLKDMDEMITRRIEWMCAEILRNNAVSMDEKTDDKDKPIKKHIAFYDGSANDAIFTPAKSWSEADATILEDIGVICKTLRQHGLPAVDVIMGSDAADSIMSNEKILKLLDNRRYELGVVDPTQMFDDAVLCANLNVKGSKLNFIQYDGSYQDEQGKLQYYIKPDEIIITAPNCGVTNYGAIYQIDYGATDFRKYVGRRVPRFEIEKQTKSVILSSAPFVQPKNRNPFIYSNVLF